MKISIRLLDLLSLAWIALGVVVFLLGWCRWYYSVPLALLISAVIFIEYKNGDGGYVEISKRKFCLAFAICILIMLLSGVGGYVVQSNDHYWRNAMFRDLVNYSWPVYDETTGLTKSYYIGFWMVPALLAKLFHSMELGFLMQLLWISAGFQLMFLQVCCYMGKARVSYLFFFYFFAGLKVVECLLYFPVFGGGVVGNTINALATNATPGYFHAGPMAQLLYDPFNQTIPLFLGMMLMINNRRSNILPFVFALLMLYAPLPLVGLAPLVLYWFVKNISSAAGKLRYVFSWQNAVSLVLLAVISLYLMSNDNSGHKGLREFAGAGEAAYSYAIYIVFEFAIFMDVGYKACRDKAALWIAFACVCIFGWFQVGLHNDFCFRTNMPLIFILFLLVTKRYYMSETSRRLRNAIIICYIAAGVPAQIHPMLRWLSSACIIAGVPQEKLNDYQHFKDVRQMYVMQQTKLRNDDLPSSFRCKPEMQQFRTDVGTPRSFFFQYIAKKIRE